MLVLSRKEGESIMVGEYRVTVVRMVGGKVRIGITAPESVPVHRLEVYERSKGKENATSGAAA